MADIDGDDNDNNINGTASPDKIEGKRGNDTIYGLAGDDEIDGDDGNDLLFGGEDDDSIDGGKGRDTVYGGAGNDEIKGGSGSGGGDALYGEAGNDTLEGSKGDDRLAGGEGDDSIEAGSGNDVVLGGQGNDTLDGGKGNDSIAGGAGDDMISGGSGHDVIRGNAGNDTIDGGKGDDFLCGDDGDDVLLGGSGNDSLYGGAGEDLLFGGKGGSGSGGGGDSFYVGRQGGGTDTVFGGAPGTGYLKGGAGGSGSGNKPPFGSASGQDINDILYVEGPVEVTLQSGETFTLTPGQMRQIVNEHDHIDDDLQDGGFAVLDDGTRIEFDDIGKIASRENVNPPPKVICFTPGTLVATVRGQIPVEDIREGDRLITRDNGLQSVCWTGSKALSAQQLQNHPELRPVLIRAGSIGPNMPEVDMLVSPNHRMLMTGGAIEMIMSETEILVAAKHMTGKAGIIAVEPYVGVNYIHIMCEQHQVILADGAWTESFQPGDYSLGGLHDSQRSEIFTLFPELQTSEGLGKYDSARTVMKKHEARLIV